MPHGHAVWEAFFFQDEVLFLSLLLDAEDRQALGKLKKTYFFLTRKRWLRGSILLVVAFLHESKVRSFC